MNRKNKRQSGITLIALTVTIIVLIILAGISVSILTGKNGIINRAKDAKEKYEGESANEESNLNELDKEWSNKTNRQGTLEVIETTEDSIKVKMKADNASEYQFSLDGSNWTDSQSQCEYTFTGLEKVIANADNYKKVSGTQYKVYSKIKFDDGEEGLYGPKIAKTRVEAVYDKEYEYTDLGSEICVTGLKSEGYIENPSSMEELDNKIKELQVANVIPSYINGKPVTQISSKLLKQKTNQFINENDDTKIYVYYKESSDATATLVSEQTISASGTSSFTEDGGGRKFTFALKNQKTGYYKVYGFLGNSYGVTEFEYNTTSGNGITLEIKNNSNPLVLPPTLKETVDSGDSNTANVVEVAKVASLDSFKLVSVYNPDPDASSLIKTLTLYVKNKRCTDTTNIAFLGRNDKSDIKNISIFDNVMASAKQKVIEYYN